MRLFFPVSRAALGIALAVSVAGCISFGAKPPPSLLTLSATQAPPAGPETPGAGRPITIEVPAAPQTLATARVPVQTTPTTVAYVPKALWAEPPNRLFARLLADTLTVRSGRVVVSGVQAVGDPAARLGGELRGFGIDAGPRQAVVTYDATLVRGATGAPLEKRRFEARVPVAAIDADNAGVALNQAANQVAAQVADWVGR